MFRIFSSFARKLSSVPTAATSKYFMHNSLTPVSIHLTSTLNRNIYNFSNYNLPKFNPNISSLVCTTQANFLKPKNLLDNQCRSLIKFSMTKGKRKSVKCVLKRFKRLDWGIWIRTRSGRHKKMFKKSPALKRRLKQHVFVNAAQSWLLDSMVTKFWRKPKYYVDDPYEQYHKREEYFATRKKPIDFVSK